MSTLKVGKMSHGMGMREAGIVEQIIRLGHASVARLRMPYTPWINPTRPVLIDFQFGSALYSRQSINRALLKLERLGIVLRRFSTKYDELVYILDETITRQAFRAAGEALAAHLNKTPFRFASIEGIQYRKNVTDAFAPLVGVAAEQKAVAVYKYKEPAVTIKAAKKYLRLAEKLVDQNSHTVLLLAEHLIVSKKLSRARIADLIDNPGIGD